MTDSAKNTEAIESANDGTLAFTITMLLPADLLIYIKECGALDWGAVPAKEDAEHVADFAKSIQITREHFSQQGPQMLHGLYMAGTDTVAAHTGTSPNSPKRAQILTGLWNALHSAVTDARS
jgi:hypothetical protein